MLIISNLNLTIRVARLVGSVSIPLLLYLSNCSQGLGVLLNARRAKWLLQQRILLWMCIQTFDTVTLFDCCCFLIFLSLPHLAALDRSQRFVSLCFEPIVPATTAPPPSLNPSNQCMFAFYYCWPIVQVSIRIVRIPITCDSYVTLIPLHCKYEVSPFAQARCTCTFADGTTMISPSL